MAAAPAFVPEVPAAASSAIEAVAARHAVPLVPAAVPSLPMVQAFVSEEPEPATSGAWAALAEPELSDARAEARQDAPNVVKAAASSAIAAAVAARHAVPLVPDVPSLPIAVPMVLLYHLSCCRI
jgi:hypothetical protein